MVDQRNRIDIHSRAPVFAFDTGDVTSSGQFFAEEVKLAPGHHAARIQVVFSEYCNDETISVEVAVAGSVGETVLGAAQVVASRTNRSAADEIFISFHVSAAEGTERVACVVRGRADRNCATTLLRHITILPVFDRAWTRSDFFAPREAGARIADLEMVFLGTTGRCNASCIHCPTNKPDRQGSNGVMSRGLYEKLIRELAEGGFRGRLMFGLFGEPLNDPQLIARLQHARAVLPQASISVSTNAGLFDEARHAGMLEFLDVLAVHVESADPRVYDEIMTPLQAERVFPKVERLLELNDRTFNRAISINSPIHRMNLGTAHQLRERFGASGRFHVNFAPLSSRSWEVGMFPELALAPMGTACKPSVLRQIVMVDWDGQVLPCCADFQKSLPLGNLSWQSFEDVFASPEWRALSETFRRGEWSSRPACARCRHDHDATVAAIAHDAVAARHPPVKRYPPRQFSIRSGAARESDGAIHVDNPSPHDAVIFGPYAHLPPGRYILSHELEVDAGSPCSVLFDVALDYCRAIPVAGRLDLEPGDHTCHLEFDHAGAGVVEFRVSKLAGATFRFKGTVLRRVSDHRPAPGKGCDAAPPSPAAKAGS